MKSNFYIKLTHWEFWTTGIVYIPVVAYFAWLALRMRSLFFFTAVNPNMEAGGLFGASKYKQLCYLPPHLKPKTVFVPQKSLKNIILATLSAEKIAFPCIAKPDKAERGIGVALLKNEADLTNYLQNNKTDFVVQSYIDYPFEAGVFVYKMPNATHFTIPSIVVKEFLSVTGDGKTNLKTLILQNFRAKLVWERLAQTWQHRFDDVLAPNEQLFLEPIGNHNRGTKFINSNHLISPELEAIFTDICTHLPDFHYGRLDLRAPSLDAFLRGENIKIMEVNGINAEPAHIYDPAISPITGWKTLLHHWSIIYKISKNNIHNGLKTMTLQEGIEHYKNWQNATQ